MRLPPCPRLNKGEFVILATVAIIVAAYLILRFPLNRLLEDRTGETQLRQQLEALFIQWRLPTLDTRDMEAIAHTDAAPFGMNTFFEQEVEVAKVRRSMEMLRDAGVRWVRQQFPWADIETPAKDVYIDRYGQNTWDKYDRIVDLAREHGLEMVVRVDYPPAWARTDQSNAFGPPDRYEDYGDFLYTLATRYKGKLRYYQVWNEPNLYHEWGDQMPNARDYTELLKTAYTRIKEADPDAIVLSAALSPTVGTPGDLNQSDLAYLQQMYDAGAGGYFDILAAQGYGLWTGPGNRRAQPSQVNFSRPLLLREIMVRNGDAGKPVWATEVGWNALPKDFEGDATHGRVTRGQQARYTEQGYARALDEWPWMGVLFFWHFRRVTDEEKGQVQYYFGMVEADFTAHPAYYAYKRMARQPPVLDKGYHQQTHWAITYEGGWRTKEDGRAALDSYAIGSPGDRLSFRFKGRQVELVTTKGPQEGRLLVWVDGDPVPGLPRDEEGRSYVDLASDREEWQARTVLATHMNGGEHSLEMQVAQGEPAIDGIVVLAPASRPSRLALAAALLLGVAVGLAALLLMRRQT